MCAAAAVALTDAHLHSRALARIPHPHAFTPARTHTHTHPHPYDTPHIRTSPAHLHSHTHPHPLTHALPTPRKSRHGGRFYEASGRYPTRLTVVSFGFKKRRFLELHRAALRYPRSTFAYVGLDPRGLSNEVLRGELTHSSKPFERDPYGCAQPELRTKRLGRNPFRRGGGTASYAQSCPALRELLLHCETAVYRGRLPWSERVGDEEDSPGARSFYSAERQQAPQKT